MTDWQTYEPDLDETLVERFTFAERLQHIVLMTSLGVLFVTGLPLLFSETPAIRLFGGVFSLRTFLHRFAGGTLVFLSAFHILYVMFTDRGRRDFGRILPRFEDIGFFLHHVKFQLGRVDHPPHFDKFDPFEKFEYFAVVWGSIVMVVTGLMLWFFESTLRVLPLWAYQLALIIHGNEGLLAFLAIILWHLYNVHLKPGVFPMSRVWIDGKITLREMQEHHPREYERWLRKQRIRRAEEQGGA